MAGFGSEYIIKYSKEYFNKYFNEKTLFVIETIILICFLVMAFSYTQRDNWRELKLHSLNGQVMDPNSPANEYFNKDDLRLFNFSEKRFISPGWKGLVIGSSTGNYPLDSKSSTISVEKLGYDEFIGTNCENKRLLSKKFNINYVYSSSFNCSGFKLVGVSGENLNLYVVDV